MHKIVNIFGFHKNLTRYFSEKFLLTVVYLIWQYVQLLINPVSGLIEGGAEEHEQVADSEHGIVLNCAAAYFMKSGSIHLPVLSDNLMIKQRQIV